MRVYRSLQDLPEEERTVTALGNFDGVHLGHRRILQTAREKADELGCLAACYTFSNHPRRLFKDLGVIDETVGYINSDEEKLYLLEQAGMDIVFNVEFSPEVMNLSPENFVERVICGSLHALGVSCGNNYRFGTKASGTPELLTKLGGKYGFEAYVHDDVKIEGETISSTLIRRAIEVGDMERAELFLGRPYRVAGRVIQGNHIGTKIGIPTANIPIDPSRVAPPNGVYFTLTKVDGEVIPSVTNIGVKPTVGNYDKVIETHLLGRKYDLYGKELTVEFLHYRRPEHRFGSLEELRSVMNQDVAAAGEYHGI